jgi:hypothetical protein
MKVTSNCIVSFKTVDCNSVALSSVMLIVARLVEKVSVLYYSAVPISAFCYTEELD